MLPAAHRYRERTLCSSCSNVTAFARIKTKLIDSDSRKKRRVPTERSTITISSNVSCLGCLLLLGLQENTIRA